MSYFHAINGQGGSPEPTPSNDHPPVLLWTNPSPTSEFSPQKIDLDLTNYIGVIVEYKYTYNVDFMCTRTFVKKDDVMTYSIGGNTAEYGSGCGYVTSNGGWSARGRTITSIDNTGITFGKGGYANSLDNGHFIPTKIYGVQEYVVEPTIGTTLWTNANNRAEFNAQTISLQLGGFDAIELTYTLNNEDGIVERRIIIPVGESVAVGESLNSDTETDIRGVTVSSTGVTFGNGGYATVNSFTRSGKYIIPLTIKGVKYN